MIGPLLRFQPRLSQKHITLTARGSLHLFFHLAGKLKGFLHLVLFASNLRDLRFNAKLLFLPLLLGITELCFQARHIFFPLCTCVLEGADVGA